MIIRKIISDINKKVNIKKRITLLEYFIICPLWDYYVDFSTPKEVTKKQGNFSMDDLGGYHYYDIFNSIALHSNSKGSKDKQELNLTFNELAERIIEEHSNEINEEKLEESLEKIVKENEDYKRSKFRWSPKRLEDVLKIYNSLID